MDSATATTHLNLWLAADQAVSKGQSYSIAGRTLTRASVAEIRDQIAYWQHLVDIYSAAALGAAQPRVLIATKT